MTMTIADCPTRKIRDPFGFSFKSSIVYFFILMFKNNNTSKITIALRINRNVHNSKSISIEMLKTDEIMKFGRQKNLRTSLETSHYFSTWVLSSKIDSDTLSSESYHSSLKTATEYILAVSEVQSS